MARRLFIGRMRRYDTDGELEDQHLYVGLFDDPDADLPCGVPVGAKELADLILMLESAGRLDKRPTFEPPSIVECPGCSGHDPRVYEALSLDEIAWVRHRLRL